MYVGDFPAVAGVGHGDVVAAGKVVVFHVYLHHADVVVALYLAGSGDAILNYAFILFDKFEHILLAKGDNFLPAHCAESY